MAKPSAHNVIFMCLAVGFWLWVPYSAEGRAAERSEVELASSERLVCLQATGGRLFRFAENRPRGSYFDPTPMFQVMTSFELPTD